MIPFQVKYKCSNKKTKMVFDTVNQPVSLLWTSMILWVQTLLWESLFWATVVEYHYSKCFYKYRQQEQGAFAPHSAFNVKSWDGFFIASIAKSYNDVLCNVEGLHSCAVHGCFCFALLCFAFESNSWKHFCSFNCVANTKKRGYLDFIRSDFVRRCQKVSTFNSCTKLMAHA